MSQVVEMTLDELKEALPKKNRGAVSQDLLDEVNKAIAEPEFYRDYRDNLVSYTSVLQEGRFKIADYINAVKYVTARLMGKSGFEAYIKTFPDRYQALVNSGTPTNTIHAYASMYKKNQLVNLIYAQTVVPMYVLNMDMYQEALNTQRDLMLNAESEKVRSDAANSLLIHLKVPEVAKVELDINVKQDNSIAELRNATAALAQQCKEQMLAGNMSAKEVAEARIIQGECHEIV